MDYHRNSIFTYSLILLCLVIISCNNNAATSAGSTANKTADTLPVAAQAGDNIREIINYALEHNGQIDDNKKIELMQLVSAFYQQQNDEQVWSRDNSWKPLADSLLQFINTAEMYGLYPAAYHAAYLKKIKAKLAADTLQQLGKKEWARADIAMTDACLKLLKDIKYGRLGYYSTRLKTDSVKVTSYLLNSVTKLLQQGQFTTAVNSAEPVYKGYHLLKQGIRRFLDSMDRREYTYVAYPYKNEDEKDSLNFIKTLQKRLGESNCMDIVNRLPDSAELNTSIKKYQKLKALKQDGKITSSLIKLINSSDVERYKRIAVTLDRYKQLPDTLPQKYIWVNLPGYYLELWDSDTLALQSKIICGKPETRTPLLYSAINNMVTYPTWTVPTSIIAKQYLPKLKNNPHYLARIGLKLVGPKGEAIDPASVNWAKYNKGIPYKVMQNSGDDNALGVLKFNFNNPYAVYLHDTNQRYLFKKSARALSHGCVRVQEWEKLAFYIARNDSLNLAIGDTLRYTADSIRNWIAEKKTKRIPVKNEIPLFINYFSCEGKDGKIRFYEDIYGDDKALREKYFSSK
jgi:L,D-transpeptidase YcbB